MDHVARIPGPQLREWVRRYDQAPLDRGHPPPRELFEIAESADCIATSTLRRSLESARWLAPDRELVSERHFCEAGLPGRLPLPLPLGPDAWTLAARLAWLCGWSPGSETLRQADRRARAAAEQLAALARGGGSVLLLGHGIINGMIARHLRRRGYRGPHAFGGTYWASYQFEPRSRPEPRR